MLDQSLNVVARATPEDTTPTAWMAQTIPHTLGALQAGGGTKQGEPAHTAAGVPPWKTACQFLTKLNKHPCARPPTPGYLRKPNLMFTENLCRYIGNIYV